MNSADTRNTLLGSALTYARAGLPVIPLLPCAKAAFTPHGVYDATRDPDTIRSWWAGQPDRNVAVIPPANVQVVDVEADGIATVADLHLPHTVIARTGGGGWHYWYRLPDGVTPVNRTRVLPNVDLKAGPGGYLVAPPSIHPDTRERYEWADLCGPGEVKIADAPSWLVDLVTADRRAGVTLTPRDDVTTDADRLPDVIREGTRNDTLFRFGCRLRSFGAGHDTILRALIGVNLERCAPSLEVREVERIATSACRYEPGPVRIANKILGAAQLTDGAIFLALLIAATADRVTTSEVADLASVTTRTVRSWRRELRKADLLDAARERPRDRYTLLPLEVVLHPDLTRAEKRLYCWLTRIADPRGIARAGQEVLAERIGATDRTSVHRYAKALEAAGLVTVNRARYARSLGRRTDVNRYRIAARDPKRVRRPSPAVGSPARRRVEVCATSSKGRCCSPSSRSWNHDESYPDTQSDRSSPAVVVPSAARAEAKPPPPADELPGKRAVRLRAERREADDFLNRVYAEWREVLREVRIALGSRFPTDARAVHGLEVAAGQLIARDGADAAAQALIALFAEEVNT
jgi:CRP-like cAMP-binding protein